MRADFVRVFGFPYSRVFVWRGHPLRPGRNHAQYCAVGAASLALARCRAGVCSVPCQGGQASSRCISSSTAPGSLGTPQLRTSPAAAVISTSSSMRMPMPRHQDGASLSSAPK